MIHIAYIIPILKVDMSLPFLARFPDGSGLPTGQAFNPICSPGNCASSPNKHYFILAANFIGFPPQAASMSARTNGKVTTTH